jgi:hypothetical protein
MAYLRHPNCRICAIEDHKVVSDIDFELLNGASINTILGKYGHFFGTPVKPGSAVSPFADEEPLVPSKDGFEAKPMLNYGAVYWHRSHIKKDVTTSLLGLPEAGSGVRGETEIVKGERAAGFNSYIDELHKNKETLDVLLHSAFEDLNQSDEYLLKSLTPKYQALILSVRDNIRKSIAALTSQIQESITPTLNNLNSKNNPQIIELLMIVKKAAALAIKDKDVREAFKSELAVQIAYSKELKWLMDDKDK